MMSGNKPFSDPETRADDDDKKLESKLTQTFLNLERIDPLLYRSTHLFKPYQGRAVFGGQVVGQALVAASNTVPTSRHVHSLHSYFLRPGNIDQPILYHVQEIRDGGTYSNRFVNATQQGKSIFTMMVSFKLSEEDDYSHQFKMPVVPPPEECTEIQELLKQRLGMDIGDRERDYIRNRLSEEITILRKPVDPQSYFGAKPRPARQLFWMRVKGHVGPNPQMQNCAAAYITDSVLLGTSLLPSGHLFRESKFFMTSLDHTIWFHQPIKVDEWLLYEMESPQCGQGRCMCLGRMWDQRGSLKMSVSQEGVLRTGSVKSGESTHAGPNVVKGRNSTVVGLTGGSGADTQQANYHSKGTTVIASAQNKSLGSVGFRRFFQLAHKFVRLAAR